MDFFKSSDISLPVKLYNYQKRWIQDNSRFKIGMFARQTGKTFATTLEIVNDCFQAEAQGQKRRWVILSSGERQALEAMETSVRRHCEAYQKCGLFLCGPLNEIFYPKINRYDIIFPGGSKISAVPANPVTARGFSANIFLDEFAFHPESHQIWSALFPIISAGHKIRITSTPNGRNNKFFQLMTAPELDNIWSRHVTDIYQAVSDGLPLDTHEIRSALADEIAWRQEYELNWQDEATSWLSYDLIESAEDPLAGYKQNYQGYSCFAGVDIATRGDCFVIWILELVEGHLWTREIITKTNISFEEQDRLLDEVFRHYQIRRCCMDQTGIGEKPVEDAKKRHGFRRVEGINFTAKSKQMLAITGKNAFEKKILHIPAQDENLRKEFHSIEKTIGPTGIPKFVNPRNKQGHADRAWACFLACHAARDLSITKISSRHTRQTLTQGY